MYYINPLTDRVIKSTGKIYQKLKQRRFKLEPDHCLYNNTTARRCMLKLLRRYPNVYLSSSYTDIPATYKSNSTPKLQNVRAFIEKEPGTGIASGYITKDGTLFKLNKEIELKPNDIVVQTASDTDSNVLLTNLDNSQVISPDTQEIIEQHNFEPISDSVNIVYNPIKNDFIPIKGKIENVSDIVNEYNNSDIDTTESEPKTEPEPKTEITEPEIEPETTEPETTEPETEATSELTESEITEPETTFTKPEDEPPYHGLKIITDKDDNVIGFI